MDAKCGAAAAALHEGFEKACWVSRKSIATHMLLAELGRFRLQIDLWHRILLCYRSRHNCQSISLGIAASNLGFGQWKIWLVFFQVLLNACTVTVQIEAD